jgi:hypothetical protein
MDIADIYLFFAHSVCRRNALGVHIGTTNGKGMNSKAQTALRIELELLNRAELLVPVLRRDPLVRALGQVSRSSVLRIALAKGLALLERETGTVPSLPVPTATESSDPMDSVVVFSDDWSELRHTTPPTTPAPNADPQAAGRRIEALHTQGFSLREIAQRLTTEGIPTRRGGQWHASTVRAVLQRIQT